MLGVVGGMCIRKACSRNVIVAFQKGTCVWSCPPPPPPLPLPPRHSSCTFQVWNSASPPSIPHHHGKGLPVTAVDVSKLSSIKMDLSMN